MQIKASRITEPPKADAEYPGYPVARHIITFDDDFDVVRWHGRVGNYFAQPTTCRQMPEWQPWHTGSSGERFKTSTRQLHSLQDKPGKVWRNKTGFLYDEPVMINMNKDVGPGWHKMTVQGKATDTVLGGVQTGKLLPNPWMMIHFEPVFIRATSVFVCTHLLPQDQDQEQLA